MEDLEYRVGSMAIIKVPELDLNDFAATQLLPDLKPETPAQHPGWRDPRTYDAKGGKVLLSVHTWVIRAGGKTILIDTAAGNDKARPTMKVLDHLNTPYLARLAAVGVRPEDVAYADPV